jgi:hypothetical protein
MQKNISNQKWTVFAFDITDNTAKTGDAGQITANIKIDGGSSNATDDVAPTELEDGYYEFDLTQAETNGEHIRLFPSSSTGDIQVIGVPGAVYTTPANFPDLGIESDGDVTKVNLVDLNTDMVGTNSAALASVCTEGRLGELDSGNLPTDVAAIPTTMVGTDNAALASDYTSARAGYLDNINGHTAQTGDTYALANGSTGFVAIDTVVDAIKTVTDDWVDGARLDLILDIIAADVINIDGSAMTGTNNALLAANVPTNFSSLGIESDGDITKVNLVDTNTDMVGTNNALLAANVPTNFSSLGIESDGDITKVNLVDTNTDMRGTDGVDTSTMRGTDSAALASDYTSARAGYLDFITSINTTVNDIISMLDDPRSEPGQGAPSVNADAMTKLDYLYKFMRNKVETGTTTISIYDNAGTTIDQLATISAAGSTFTRGEFGTGV